MPRHLLSALPLLLLAACSTADRPHRLTDPDADKLPPTSRQTSPQVLARDAVNRERIEDRHAAILQSLHLSGIAVIEPQQEGRVVRPAADPSQGLAFTAGETYAIARTQANGYRGSLMALAGVMAALLPDPGRPDSIAMRDGIVDGIRRWSREGTATQKAWASLVVEHGRAARPAYDLLDATRFPRGGSWDVDLDAVQMMLVVRRLAADLAVAAGTKVAAHGPVPVHVASILPLPFEGSLRATLQEPCGTSGTERTIMDHAAAGSTTLIGELTSYLADLGVSGAEAGQKLQAAVGAALSLGQFILAGANTKGRVEFFDGPQYLQRNKSAQAGERRRLKLILEMDSSGWQYLNCARLALNAVGVDFAVDGSGPVSGADVRWHMGEGKAEGRSGTTSTSPIQFASGAPLTGRTDGEGKVITVIEGRERKYPLPSEAEPVIRRASVRATYNLKGSELDLTKSLTSAAFTAAGGPVAVLMEMLNRLTPFDVEFRFPVHDFASDYRVDHTQSWVRITSAEPKCERLDGDWDLDITGTAPNGMTARGLIMIKGLQADIGRGAFEGTIGLDAPAGPVQGIAFKITGVGFAGQARLLTSQGYRLQLDPRITRGSMQIGNTDKPLMGPGSPLTLPIQVGAFCE